MTDWSKLKVVDLKEECKARGIPLTGLKLKQQYIDTLDEYEAQNAKEPNDDADPIESAEPEEQQTAAHENGADAEAAGGVTDVNDPVQKDDLEGETEEDKPVDLQKDSDPVEDTTEDKIAEEVVADKDVKEVVAPEPSGEDTEVTDAPATTAEVASVTEKVDEEMADVSQQAAPATPTLDSMAEVEIEDAARDDDNATQKPAALSTPQILSDTSTPLSSQIPPSDIAEDQRKRRKRSATPDPSVEEIARKKARLSEAAEGPKADVSSLLEQDNTEESANEVPEESVVEETKEVLPPTDPMDVRDDATPEESKVTEKALSPPPVERSRSPSEERDVAPAIHLATSALYIRNFKRPLHIPSLRSHIASIAKARSGDDSEAITLFYLDSIRTHAFVAFSSIAAASRVRAAMHGTRFPDEALREPLFVDYVPEDKVQSWVDEETGGGFGRGGGGRRYEVVYEEGKDGIEAIFQEVDTNKPRPPTEPSRSRQSIDRQKPEALPQGIHPDRAGLVPHDRRDDDDGDQDRPRAPPTGPRNPGSTGRGFKALDELFDSTTAKPKLYFKPVADSIATERLEMFRDLRGGYTDMGRSGDAGMKRYSFDRYKDHEEFVDKGPEFGYGKRGQARLTGGGAGGPGGGGGFGGGRGRGGFRGRGDSWRGGAR